MLNARNIPFKRIAVVPKTYTFTSDKKVSVRLTETDLEQINIAIIKDGYSPKKRSAWIDSCVRKLLSLDAGDFDFIFDPSSELIHIGTKPGETSTSIPVGLSNDTITVLNAKIEGIERTKKPHLIKFAIDYRMSNLGI